MPTPIRVLIADDHTVIRKALRVMLCSHPDIDCIAEAGDGREAYEKAVELRPDVVLMDITMPRLNGIEATRLITSERPDVKVVGLSMHTPEDMAKAMKQAGAVAFVTKAAAPEELLAAVRHAVSAA